LESTGLFINKKKKNRKNRKNRKKKKNLLFKSKIDFCCKKFEKCKIKIKKIKPTPKSTTQRKPMKISASSSNSKNPKENK